MQSVTKTFPHRVAQVQIDLSINSTKYLKTNFYQLFTKASQKYKRREYFLIHPWFTLTPIQRHCKTTYRNTSILNTDAKILY